MTTIAEQVAVRTRYDISPERPFALVRGTVCRRCGLLLAACPCGDGAFAIAPDRSVRNVPPANPKRASGYQERSEPVSVVGRTYLERGEPVTVLVGWRSRRKGDGTIDLDPSRPTGAPRNVMIQRADGSRTVRPFRGLRRVSTGG
jgi:hypothetical protein